MCKRLKLFIPCSFLFLYIITWNSCSQALTLVKDGKPHSIIITDNAPSNQVKLAVNELQKHVLKATGAQLQVVTTLQLGKVPNEYGRILIGPSNLTKKLGLSVENLQTEQARIFSNDNHLVFIGNDNKKSSATFWAVCDFLDCELGARWIWPGELGLFIPKMKSIVIANHIDKIITPEFQFRKLRYHVIDQEVDQWVLRHRMGVRLKYKFGHAFGDWWEKYSDKHTDYFAVPPNGISQPWPGPKLVKLNIGNPDVQKQIIAEWIAAGKPDNWNVSPNDGAGWCTSKLTRALDPPEFKTVPAHQIWDGSVSLTTRYIKFWNSILKSMREMNPNVVLSTYAYSAYREAPVAVVPESGMVIGIVNTYHAYDSWIAWESTGAMLLLRPNWLHIGGCTPHLPLHDAGNFFKYACNHSMIGFDFDSIMGFWGTQGPFYYLIARLSVHPEMSIDEVISEFTSAFGSAAPAIKKYITYWEDFTVKTAYTIPAGGAVSQDNKGNYEQLVRKHDLPRSPLNGGWRVIPYLYTDVVLETAFAILNEADNLAKNDPDEVLERIDFLREGLRYLILVRNVVTRIWSPLPGSDSEKITMEAIKKLYSYGKSPSHSHAVWGAYTFQSMIYRGIIPKKYQYLEDL